MAKPHFTHVIVLDNPKSTNADESRQYLDALKQANPRVVFEEIPISKKTLTELGPRLKNDTLLCVDGGDGTVNSTVQALLADGEFSKTRQRTPILPIWGGNANDIAHNLNGEPSIEKCQHILEKARVVPVYPLRCTIKASKETKVRIAICYASFGATAHAARHFNEPSFRKNPLLILPGGRAISEAASGLKALADAPTFVVEYEGGRKTVYDWIIGKGQRMAKMGHLPVSLTDRVFYQGMIEHKSLPDVLNRAASMAWDRLEPANTKKPITFTTTEPIWAQFDGEPLELPANTIVTIGLNPQPFYALSTNAQL